MLQPGSEIICDSKSGVTGAGRGARADLLFGEVSESFRPYSPMAHRHGPEMCQELAWEADRFTFVPHLLPVNRGILSTMYVNLRHAAEGDEIESTFRRRYGSSPFVRVLGGSRLPELRSVAHTNFCDVAWRLNGDGRRAVVFSALDNLLKGAAGQAVQNFELMHGLGGNSGSMDGKAVAIHD
jgi:N-acetyl-gamma-glutamyl-phosphate reductase